MNLTPVNMLATVLLQELVSDGMQGGSGVPDILIKRIVGSVNIAPQSAATATSTVGLGIFRARHAPDGGLQAQASDFDPLNTDVDSFGMDWLWRRVFTPQYGGPFDATALDFNFEIPIDLRGRPTLRKLDRVHSIQLVHIAETASRVQLQIHLRILTGIAGT